MVYERGKKLIVIQAVVPVLEKIDSAVRAHKNIVMYSLSLFILSSSSIPVFSVKYLCLSVHFLGIKC